MKKHFIVIAAAAALMIAIPLFTVKNNAVNDINKKFISNKENKAKVLTGILANEFNENYCEEGLKAAAIILNSNYKAGQKLKSVRKTDFMKKHKNGAGYYSLIEKAVKKINGKVITHKGKTALVPCSFITDGKCESVYPYIRNTDNPWDLLNKNYTYKAKSGVSLNSINELCKKGLSCEQSLKRYLKDIKIEPSR